jgi:FMN phosphatase YigB (HAD superfamily)
MDSITYSFDVFDTVLTRAVSRPSAVFLLTGAYAPGGIPAGEFARLRVQGERQAEQKAAGGQAGFDSIYQELGVLTGWCEADLSELRCRELEIEKRLMHGVPQLLAEMAKARYSGQQVIFISDMYLPSNEIEGFLVHCGAWKEGDRLYVSCEWGASKREGGLFHRVLKEESLSPDRLKHYGDNEIGDVQKPLSLGVRAALVRPAELNPYEMLLDRFTESTAGLAALLAGASCVARLKLPQGDEHMEGLQTVACSVAAPVLTAFAGWVLQEAARRGIRRLYFVARDGYVIKKFAEHIASTMDAPPELRYLYGSRQAWRSVSLDGTCVGDLAWAFEATESVSLHAVFERLGTTPSIAQEELLSWGYPTSEWSRALTATELKVLLMRFESSGVLHQRLSEAISPQRAAALAYLKDEGLFDEMTWAIVDLGWHGSLQSSLTRLIAARGGRCPLGLYFGLRSRGSKGPANSECAAFAFDVDRGDAEISVPDLVYLMESFCTASHGTCKGYEAVDGRSRPVFRKSHGNELEEWGLGAVHKAYATYLDVLAVEFFRNCDWKDLKAPLFELLREFSRKPGIKEAKAWGRFPYENDQNASSTSPLAEAKTADLRSLFYCMKIGEAPHAFIEWQGGAWCQTKTISLWCLICACGIGRAKRFMANLVKLFGKNLSTTPKHPNELLCKKGSDPHHRR